MSASKLVYQLQAENAQVLKVEKAISFLKDEISASNDKLLAELQNNKDKIALAVNYIKKNSEGVASS